MNVRTHSVLVHHENKRITSVQDHFGGRVLRVLWRHFPVGESVETGPIVGTHTGQVQLDRKIWIVIGHAHWREARKMANAAGSTRSLHPGVWHVVISE